jgi:hypothetical protein
MAGSTGGGGRPTLAPGGGGEGGPNGPGNQPPQESQDDPDASKVTLRVKDRILVLAVDLNLQGHEDVAKRFLDGARLVVLQVKGREDMLGRSRIHELADALKRYVTAKGGAFPRGTVDRVALDPEARNRAGLPYPPDERVSWMADLLPFLGPAEFAAVEKRIDRALSWNDPKNLQNALTLVPFYLSNAYPQTTWWGLYPGMPVPVANSHFVGMAGVGADAAEYAPNDPAAAKRLGVFGYDRITRLADITDGPAKTIAVIQVPADYKTPWLAGGGSTVRGVPEKDSIRPFVCATYNGKRGTFAVMADGKVRFIPETISDADFQALCTIAGGETVDVDKVAPVVAPDSLKVEMRAAGGLPALPSIKVTPPPAPAAPPPPPPASSPPAGDEGKRRGPPGGDAGPKPSAGKGGDRPPG